MSETTGVKQVFQDYMKINRTGFFEDQASIEFPEGEANALHLQVTLTPIYGFFTGAKITFRFTLPKNYPEGRPTVKCLTKVYHPNISFRGDICFSMFSSDWNKEYRLDHYINGLLWLLSNPNPDSALNSSCRDSDMKVFEENVKKAMRGESVKGTKYPNILVNYVPEPVITTTFEYLVSFIRYICQQLNTKEITIEEMWNEKWKSVTPTNTILQMFNTKQLKGKIIEIGSGSTVAHRVKKLKDVNSKHVVKELVWQVGDKVVITVSNDFTRIDTNKLAKACDTTPDKCILMPSKQIRKIGYKKRSIPFFGHKKDKVAMVIVAERMFELDHVYCATGARTHLLQLPVGEIKKLLEENECEVKIADITEQLVKLHQYDWESMPCELLAHVFSKVHPTEWKSFAAVCKHWQSSLQVLKKELNDSKTVNSNATATDVTVSQQQQQQQQDVSVSTATVATTGQETGQKVEQITQVVEVMSGKQKFVMDTNSLVQQLHSVPSIP